MTQKMTLFIKALTKIEALRKLPLGWDYGRDGPPCEPAIKNSCALLSSLHFLNADAFEILPGRNRGISLVAIRGELAAEIHVNSDGTYNLIHEKSGNEISDEQNIGLNKLIGILEEQGWHSARLFVSCIRGDTAKIWDDTLVSRLPQEQMAVCRSSAVNVSKQPKTRYAHTSRDSTKVESQVRRQFSGEYRAVQFRREYA
jgi:hypothetical protein